MPDNARVTAWSLVASHLRAGAELRHRLVEECTDSILEAAEALVACFREGGKLLVCGNGGSAADSQHLAAELTSRLDLDRPALPALALTTDTSFLTAYSNDYDYEGVFARQVEAHGSPGDVLLGISTSGASRNVLLAVSEAKSRGMTTIALCGARGPLVEHAHHVVRVPVTDTQLVQECHLAIEHALAMLVEQSLFGELAECRLSTEVTAP